MNEVATLNSIEPRRLLPVSEINELTVKANTLSSLSRKTDRVLYKLKDGYYNSRTLEHGDYNSRTLEDAERDLAEFGTLPSDTISTLTLLDHNMKTATSAQIADVLTVLHGLFVSQGDPQIMATVGVEIIEA